MVIAQRGMTARQCVHCTTCETSNMPIKHYQKLKHKFQVDITSLSNQRLALAQRIHVEDMWIPSNRPILSRPSFFSSLTTLTCGKGPTKPAQPWWPVNTKCRDTKRSVELNQDRAEGRQDKIQCPLLTYLCLRPCIPCLDQTRRTGAE